MTIEDDIAFFERVPVLNTLSRGALRILAIGAESRYVHSGDVLFNAGDHADSAFVVQEGAFTLSPNRSDRSEDVTVRTGALIGEMAMFTETRRPTTATAIQPSTVLRIPRSLFLKMLDSFPDAAAKLRDVLAVQTEQSVDDLESVRAILDAHTRK
jgi:CRP-like cAMP-binding protein